MHGSRRGGRFGIVSGTDRTAGYTFSGAFAASSVGDGFRFQLVPIALLFDLDGTLVDSIDLILASFRYTFRTHFGEVPPDERWLEGVGTPLVNQLRALSPDPSLVPAMAVTYRDYQLAHHDELLREFEGARDVLTTLKKHGHPTALVTSKMNDLARRALNHAGLGALLDVVVGADSTERHKPDPLPVMVALEQLGVDRTAALFIGDSPHDIVAGNAAGVSTVAALWGPFTRQTLEQANPSHLLAHIRELPALVEAVERGRTATA